MNGKTYIGHGTYARFDGLHVLLTTENGVGVISEIVLAPETLLCFELWLKQVRTLQGREPALALS